MKSERDYSKTNITLWLKEAEAVRFWVLMDKVEARTPFAKKSDVIRELIGLAPPRALTQDEIEYFRTGKK